MEDTRMLIKRVNALWAPSAEAEDTLMDGYARALELEAERARLERRFAAVAQTLAEDHDPSELPELGSLRQRITTMEAELARLRAVLGVVRRRLMAAAAAAAAESAAS
jgi:hypothetical protein